MLPIATLMVTYTTKKKKKVKTGYNKFSGASNYKIHRNISPQRAWSYDGE